MVMRLANDVKSRLKEASARSYFGALKAGKKPAERPDVGPEWIGLAEELERAYKKCKGDGETIARVFSTYEKKYPALADLLRSPSQARVQVNELGVPALPEAAQLPAELSRGACPELDWYVEFSREASAEGYDEYHVFCGLWLFSVIASRRVYARVKRKHFYTNLMLVLFGETSMFAKSFTAKAAKDVLYALGLAYMLAPNRITPQKLWSDMSGSYVPALYSELDHMKQERARKRLAMPGQKGLYFDEFGKFVQGILRKGSTNSEFVDLFMELDECPEGYENSTISRGGEPIEKPSIALLGAMTPPNLKENAKSGADFWTDGFWARFGFVVAPPATPDTIKEDLDDDEDEMEPPIPARLLASLQGWHERLGVPDCSLNPIYKNEAETGKYTIARDPLPETVCTMAPEVRRAWRAYRYALRRMCLTFPHRDLSGSYNRLPETAMRIAVIMASLSNNNHIEMRHWAKAQELAEILRKNLHGLYAQVNVPVDVESFKAVVEREALRHIERHGPLTLNTLKNSYMKKRSVQEIEDALKALKRVKLVEEFATSHSVKYRVKEQTEEDDE